MRGRAVDRAAARGLKGPFWLFWGGVAAISWITPSKDDLEEIENLPTWVKWSIGIFVFLSVVTDGFGTN